MTHMSYANLLGTLCIADEHRRSSYKVHSTQQRLATARPAILSSFAVEAACRSADILAETEGFRLASLAKDGTAGAAFFGGIRQWMGTLLVRAGTWIQDATPLTREPVSGA